MVIKVNDTDLRVLALFTRDYNRGFYIREVQRLLSMSSRTALLSLDRLEQMGILSSELRGKIKIYVPQRSSLAVSYFVMAEQYKSLQLYASSSHFSSLFDALSQCRVGVAYEKGFGLRCQRIYVEGSITSEAKKVARQLGVQLEQKPIQGDYVLFGDVYAIVRGELL